MALRKTREGVEEKIGLAVVGYGPGMCARSRLSLFSSASQTDACARPARDRSGSASRRRRRLENAAGAGNDGGEQEEGTTFILLNADGVGHVSASNTMRQVGGKSPTKFFTFVRSFVVTFSAARV